MNQFPTGRSQMPSKKPGWIVLIVVVIAAIAGGAVTAYRLHKARPATQPIVVSLQV
jgi:anti-sigma-K factor RskA